MKPRIALALFLSLLVGAVAVPTSADATTNYLLIVTNTTNSNMKLVGVDNNCWILKDLEPGRAIEISPGQTKSLNTEDKGSGSCVSDSSWTNLDIVFQGPGGLYPAASKGAVTAANAFPYSLGESGGWDLRSTQGHLEMRSWPRGPLPINPSQAGNQVNSSRGMFCVTAAQYVRDRILIGVRPGTDCTRPAATRGKPARGVSPAKAGPAPGESNPQVVYDMFQLAKAACYLTTPNQVWGFSGCEDSGDTDRWDLHNVKNDVKDAKPDADARVVPNWKVISSTSFTNATEAKGEQGWKYSYKHGDEVATETETGWKVGGKIEWAKKFSFPVVGKFETKVEISLEHEWGEKKEQRKTTEKEIEQEASIETEPHTKTTLLVKQNQAELLTTISANLTAGTEGQANPLGTPATRPLGISGARSQPCIGFIAANNPNSLMGLAAYARGQGYSPESVGLPVEQRSFLEAANDISASAAESARCPGYPDRFPAAFAFDGTATYKANAQGPTSAGAFAPGLPEVSVCAYSKPLAGSTAPPASGDDPCKSSVGSAMASAGTLVQGSESAGPGAVHGGSEDSLIIADDGKGGAPTGGKLRVYQGHGGEDVLQGRKHSDRLLGGGAFDIINGFGGDDQLNGQAGSDSLFGGEGNDSLSDNKGNNALYGNKGNDNLSSKSSARGGLFGGAGKDRLVMEGKGPVTLYGGKGSDSYKLNNARGQGIVEFPREGFDTVVTTRSLTLTPYVEKIVAKSGKGVRLGAGSGDQRLIGSNGNDRVGGGAGSDLLKGRGGNDRLLLQPFGFDRAYGGPGADRFKVTDRRFGVARTGKYLPVKSKSAHVIMDFKPGQGDKLVLSTRSFGSNLARLKKRKIITRGSVSRGYKPQLLFAPSRKLVSFDPDGRGRIQPRVIAILKGKNRISKKSVVITRK